MGWLARPPSGAAMNRKQMREVLLYGTARYFKRTMPAPGVVCLCSNSDSNWTDRWISPRNSTDWSSCAFVRQFSDTWQAISSFFFPGPTNHVCPPTISDPADGVVCTKLRTVMQISVPRHIRSRLPHPRISHKGRASFHDDLPTTIGAVVVVRLPSMVRNLISPTSSSPMP